MRAHARLFLTKCEDKIVLNDEKGRSSLAPLFLSIYESSLPAPEKELERLAQEAFVVISAGGETTSRILSMVIFHVVSNPHVLQRLQEEIMAAMPDATSSPSIGTMTYLVN